MKSTTYSKPKISVIICCYGGEETITAALESLLNQDIERHFFEVLIVDDGSKDKSSQIINNFIKTKVTSETSIFKYFRKKNEGLSIARNFGIEKSTADLIVYIDEDATANRDYLSTIVHYFENNPKVNCLGGEVELYNKNVIFAKLIQDSIFSLYMKDEGSVIGTNMAFRKSFLNDIGRFQPEFTYRGDETALFAKAKEKLVKGRSKQMIVKHFQPPNRKAWLNTRFENGYFTIAIDFFIERPMSSIYMKMFKSILFILSPFLFLISIPLIVVFFKTALILLVISLGLFFRKFLLNNLIQDTLKEFRKNRNNKTNLNDIIEIICLVIIGTYKSDYGYIKGYAKFKDVIWQKKPIT
ncbi:glycosyltransferase [Thalassobellus citreus]|uniref:glycosyltransferase n=1 Tax=Thalassobellus citreus TaxID=3367752 RepID=UPI00379E8A82